MLFIDLLINETTEKFALENKGIAVLSALVATLNHPETGGMEGFLNRFRQVGLAEHVTDWLQNESEFKLLPPELEAALGTATLQQIAAKAGLPQTQTTEVVAFLIPPLVRHLATRNPALATQPNDIRQALWSNQNTRLPVLAPAAATAAQHIAVGAKARALKFLRALPFL